MRSCAGSSGGSIGPSHLCSGDHIAVDAESESWWRTLRLDTLNNNNNNMHCIDSNLYGRSNLGQPEAHWDRWAMWA